MKDFLSKEETKYLIDVPNTCRYNTTASSKKLNRGGSITLKVKEKDEFHFLYCFINSSFAYWWWRIYDGGITYPVSLLNKLPLPYNLLSDDDKKEFENIAEEMIKKEKHYISTKVNAGFAQENIKFPKEYRDLINNKILKLLGLKTSSEIFDIVHANKFFLDSED